MSSLQLPPPVKSNKRTTAIFQPRSLSRKVGGPKTNKAIAESSTSISTSSISSGSGSSQRRTGQVPSYEERCQLASTNSTVGSYNDSMNKKSTTMFVPRTINDYGNDGGAFPEIHVAQYPRNMGNPHTRNMTAVTTTTKSGGTVGGGSSTGTTAAATSSALVVKTVEIDKDGKVSYDAIVTGGTNSNKLVYTKLQDIQPTRNPNESDIAIPTREQEQEEAERTNAALMSLLGQQIENDKPRSGAMQRSSNNNGGNNNGTVVESKTQFIRYSAKPDAPGYNPSASSNRVVQIFQAQVDPLMPPKHKHVKAPRGPADDPVPVLQAAPSKKLTKEERDVWDIPACISNWKNARGYTIPLDKRLAADGRGLIDTTVNADKFASLSESLYVAEQQARQEVKMRALINKKQLLQDRATREDELRQLANAARLQRGGAIVTTTTTTTPTSSSAAPQATTTKKNLVGYDDSDDDESSDESLSHDAIAKPQQHKDNNSINAYGQGKNINNSSTTVQSHIVQTDDDDDVAAKQREKLRIERKRARERDLRIERNIELKKKQKFEEERDISEKIALGVQQHMTGTGGAAAAASSTGVGSGEDGIDSRLYSTTSGFDSGFGADDEYNTYTQPLFNNNNNNYSSNYRPTRGADSSNYDADEQYDKLRRTAPVQFEKETTTTTTTK